MATRSSSIIYILMLAISVAIFPVALKASGLNKSYADIEVEQAIGYIKQLNIKVIVPMAIELAKQLDNERSLSRLFYVEDGGEEVFGLDLEGRELRGNYNASKNKVYGGNVNSFDSAFVNDVESWLFILKKYKFNGFDLSMNVDCIQVFLRPNVYIMIIDKNASKNFRAYIDTAVKSGFDGRGDAFFRIDENTIIATYRR